MTLGEALVEAKENITLKDGVLGIKPPPHEKRMSYKELCEYYNDKLFKYWMSCLGDEIPKYKKKKVLMYLLGRVA